MPGITLTHYTRTAGAIANILTHGFAWMPNRRRLAELLIPEREYARREPQQFGMVSFTELDLQTAGAHRRQFGSYGIVVSQKWAVEQGAQRVIYVDERGPLTDALRVLFAIGYRDVTARIRYPDDAMWTMGYESKRVASAVVGSSLWAHLLQLWEYLEPASSATQREWRIVNEAPIYSLKENKAEAIAAVSPPHGWALFTNVLRIQRSDVVALICAESDLPALHAVLPAHYRDVAVRMTD